MYFQLAKPLKPNPKTIYPLFISLFILSFTIAQGSLQEVLQLLGSISGKNGNNVALVKNKTTGEIKALRLGENVFDFGRLGYVDRLEMIIYPPNSAPVTITSKFGGQKDLKNTPKIATEDRYVEDGLDRNGTKTTVDSRYRDKILKEDLPKILLEAASEPVLENGSIIGFKLFQFEQNSLFWKIGVKDGDVIREINGVPLTNVARTVQLLNGLRGESAIQINILRNGAPVTLELHVK